MLPAVPLSLPTFSFWGFLRAQKRLCISYWYEKGSAVRQTSALPGPGLVNFPLSDRLRYSGLVRGLIFFIYWVFLTTLGT